MRTGGLIKKLFHMAKTTTMHPLRNVAAIPIPIPASAKTPLFSSRPSSLIIRPSPHSTSQLPSSMTTSSRDPNLDAIFEQKRTIRSKVRKELKGMSPAERSLEDAAIQNNILESPWFKSSQRLCAYICCSALREVDTSKILSEILCNQETEGNAHTGKKLYVPRVEDKNSYMRMLNISSTEDLIANSMSILEPSPVDRDGNPREDVMEASDPIDLILLPGLAFDRSGRRLGRSGGYYDMFLKKYQDLSMERKWKQPLLVALSYNLQILDEGVIPMTHFDIPVDAIVSSSGVIPITPAAKERM